MKFVHEWITDRTDYGDGDVNIVFSYVCVLLQRQPRFGLQRFRHDGLPRRALDIGWLSFGWGQYHEWFGCGSSPEVGQ